MGYRKERWSRLEEHWKGAVALTALGTWFGVSWVEPAEGAEAWLRFGFAGVRAVLFGTGFLFFVVWLETATDELEERIELRAYRFAFLAGVAGLFGYGEFVEAGAALPALDDLALTMLIIWAFASLYVRRRYAS